MKCLRTFLWTLYLMSFSTCGCLGQLSVCGRAPLNSRIVGGQDAPPGAWPWLASIHVSGVFTCGGSLINSQWVLAAAQCFPSVSASDVLVYVGRQSQSGSNPNEVNRTVSQIIVHEDYDFFTGENDIALLQLSSSVAFTDFILPVCLAANGSVFSNGTVSWVAGWGATAEGGSPPSSGALQEVQVPVIENSQCDSLFGGGFITDNMMCAGLLAGGKDACQGDSGGPLVSKQDSVWVQSGIVSTVGCGRPNRPTIYTRVSRYQAWINSRVGADQPGFVQFTSSGAGGASTTTPDPPGLQSTTFLPMTMTTTATTTTTTATPPRLICRTRPLDIVIVPAMAYNLPGDSTGAIVQITTTLDVIFTLGTTENHTRSRGLFNQSGGVTDSKSFFLVNASVDPPQICHPEVDRFQLILGFVNSFEVRPVDVRIATFITDIVYEPVFSNRNSPEFQRVANGITRVMDSISIDRYGVIIYRRTIVIAISPPPGSSRRRRALDGAEVEIEQEFSVEADPTTATFYRRGDFLDLLRETANDASLGFQIDMDSINITTTLAGVGVSIAMTNILIPSLLTLLWLAL